MEHDESESRDFFAGVTGASGPGGPGAPCFYNLHDRRGLRSAQWDLWSRMLAVEVWQAALLSLDVEPPEWVTDAHLRGEAGALRPIPPDDLSALELFGGFDPARSAAVSSPPESALPWEFYDRLRACQSSIHARGPIPPVAPQGAAMLGSPRCRVMLRDVAVLLPTVGFRVAEGMHRLAPTSIEKTADATLPDAEAAQRVTRRALIAHNQRRWPGIEKHLDHGAGNGLSAAARLDGRGWWHEARALEWARKQGYLKEDPPAPGAVWPRIAHE